MTTGQLTPCLAQINLVVKDIPTSIAFYRNLGQTIDEAGQPDWKAHHATAIMRNGVRLEFDSGSFAKQWNPGFSGHHTEAAGAVLFFSVQRREDIDLLFQRMIAGGAKGRIIAARENGREGGFVRASRYEGIIRSEWASWGGKAVLEKYGREHFVEMGKRGKRKPPPDPPNGRVMAAMKNGSRGGMRRAELFYPECRQAMAREGGTATRERYGNQFFKEIRKRRKSYRRGYLTRKTKEKLHQMIVDMHQAESNPFMRSFLQRYLQSQNREV